MLQQGLTNPQIAERLGITLDGAKYHVAEIMGKLGATSREDAATVVIAQHRPWWLAAFAPVSALWRKVRVDASTLATGGAIAVGAAAIAGLGVIAFLLLRDGGDNGSPSTLAPTATSEASPPPAGADELARFSGAIDVALQNGDEQFFMTSAAFQDIECGTVEGPPGYPRACAGLPTGATTAGMPVSVLQSEGTYYDPAQYAETLGPLFKSVDAPRLRALATESSAGWPELASYEDVHDAIVAGETPLEFNRHILTFTIGRDEGGWHIIRLVLGSPAEFLDYDALQPGDDWYGFFETWQRWPG